MWDGVGVTAKRFIHSQSAPLEFLSSASGSKGETKERVEEPSQEKEDQNTRPYMDRDPPTAVFHEDAKNDAALNMGVVQSAGREEEEGAGKGHGPQEEKVEGSKEEDEEITMHFKVMHMKEVTEDQHVSLSVTPAEDKIQETARSQEEQIHIPNMDIPPTAPEVTECWDEYILTTPDETPGGASSSKLVFTSLLSNTQTDVSSKDYSQTGWHFPAPPGLPEEVYSPLCNFPSMSHYPPVDSTVPYEGENRVVFHCVETCLCSSRVYCPSLCMLLSSNQCYGEYGRSWMRRTARQSQLRYLA